MAKAIKGVLWSNMQVVQTFFFKPPRNIYIYLVSQIYFLVSDQDILIFPFANWDRCSRRMGISMKMLVIELKPAG
jgi:hypothetical protein